MGGEIMEKIQRVGDLSLDASSRAWTDGWTDGWMDD